MKLVLFLCFIASVQARIRTLHVISEIQSRFAITDVMSVVKNEEKNAQEVTFSARLPESAFISNFTMEIDGKTVVGEVKEKERAKQVYEAAKRRGQSAGHIAENPRETNSFAISVNVRAESEVTFILTYQEVLRRTHGVYKHIVNIQPSGPVRDVQVDVLLSERGEVNRIHVPEFGKKVGEKTNKELLLLPAAKNVVIKSHRENNNSMSYISFKPDTASGAAPNGQLVVLYDLERYRDGGQIEVVNGYFVHFVAPQGIEPGNKHVVFVLDKSGSMSGRKFQQTQDAMEKILRELEEGDHFNIIMFSTNVEVWQQESVSASSDNVRRAVRFVRSANSGGSTNIDGALQRAIKVINEQQTALVSMIIFLTDGLPTAGVTNDDQILNRVARKNGAKNAIHSIAFGNGADYSMLKKLSSQNDGLARKVYEDSDSDLQLEGFYGEVASPLLTEVDIDYLDDRVDVSSLVRNVDNQNLFTGGEMVVVGRLRNPNANSVQAVVSGRAKAGRVQLSSEASGGPRSIWWPPCIRPLHSSMPMPRHIRICPPWPPRPLPTTTQAPPLAPDTLGGFVERMWAYMTIKRLLNNEQLADSTAEKTQQRNKALQLSLKYNFVTSVTSMVVVPPNSNNAKTLAEETDSSQTSLASGSSSRSIPTSGRNSRGWRAGGGGWSSIRKSISASGHSSTDVGRRIVRPRGGRPRTRGLAKEIRPWPAPPPPSPSSGKAPAPTTSSCTIDLAILLDTESGQLYDRLLSSVLDFLTAVDQSTNVQAKISVVQLGEYRNPKVVYTYNQGGDLSTIKSILAGLPTAPVAQSFDNLETELRASSKGALVMFVGHKSLSVFRATARFLAQAGVNMIPVTVTDSARIPGGVTRELLAIRNMFLRNATAQEILNALNC